MSVQVVAGLQEHDRRNVEFSFWQRLGLPSFVVLSLPKMELVTVVENIECEKCGS
jgi:hypothetical protein